MPLNLAKSRLTGWLRQIHRLNQHTDSGSGTKSMLQRPETNGVLSSLARLVTRGLRKAADVIERKVDGSAASSRHKRDAVLDEYSTGMPSAQNAVDALRGWNHALPDHVGATAGRGAFYNDARIHWALEKFGSVEGCKILELGPLEAGHTYLLERSGAAVIHSIEANKLSFLRCLVVKELLGLQNARFLLGDFTVWLENLQEPYDLIIASGVLYHMQDPLHLLELITKNSDAIYLWTHYASDAAMPMGDPRRQAFVGSVEIREWRGIKVRLYKRSYHGAWRSKSFCGGMHDLHCWMEKDDILAALHVLNFSDIHIAHDEPAHPNGPSFSIFARRGET